MPSKIDIGRSDGQAGPTKSKDLVFTVHSGYDSASECLTGALHFDRRNDVLASHVKCEEDSALCGHVLSASGTPKPDPKFSLLRGDQGSPARWAFGGSWPTPRELPAGGPNCCQTSFGGASSNFCESE